MQTLILQGRLPGLNEIIALSKRGNGKYQPYAQVKREIGDMIMWECKAQKIHPLSTMTDFTITWVCKDKRRDRDNIMCGAKFIFDGLQHAGVLPNDGWAEIGDILHRFKIDKQERVEIYMEESHG